MRAARWSTDMGFLDVRVCSASRNRATQPWTVACQDYQARDGMLIPLQCEVAWIKDGKAESYWRGRITSVSYRYN